MRFSLIILLAWAAWSGCVAQNADLVGHVFLGAERYNFSRAIASSPEDGYFACGAFEDTLVIDEDTLIASHSTAVYLTRLDGNLDPQWSKKLADSESTTFLSDIYVRMTSDNYGNVVVGLAYRDLLHLYGNTVGVSGQEGVVLLKLDPDGEFLWAEEVSGTSLGFRGVTTNSEGEIYLTGAENGDVLVRKYSTDGALIWGNTSGGPAGNDFGDQIVLDSQANVYVVGRLAASDNVYFDGLHVPMTTPSIFNISFVARYNPEGSIQWVRYVYSTSFANITAFAGLAVDAQGNVILGGRYSDYALRFSNNFPTVGAQPNGPHSFLTAFDANGTRLWVTIPPYVDTGTDANLDVKLFGDQVAVLNQFSGTVPSVNGSISTYGYNDLRVQSFSLNGELLGDLQIGGTLGEHGNGLLVSDDKLLMIGWTSSHPLHVGANELEHPDLANTFVLEFAEGENGLQEQVRDQMLRVFPNPAAGPFNILLDRASSVSRIVLRDAMGRAVLEVPTAHQRLVLHPPGCGIYLVELWEGDERLAVQRVAIL